mmetsp:Transcript_1757/g.6322  ORF Transcript_1757/g.6322 Transcript_1757/m.6322 type:complete len:219 (-) Transcript_1757:398-1054(-)
MALPPLTVRLRDTLDLVLLLDGVRVRGPLGSVDELIGEALGDGLDVTEGSLAGAGGDQVDGLVHAAERRDIHSLATDHTGGANTGGILAGAGVDDGINADLDGVLVGEEVDDLERVLDDAHRHDLLAVVAAVLHHGVHEAARGAGVSSARRPRGPDQLRAINAAVAPLPDRSPGARPCRGARTLARARTSNQTCPRTPSARSAPPGSRRRVPSQPDET